MKTKFFTDDQSFRDLLEKQNELKLWDLGADHLSSDIMRKTLHECAEGLSYFLFDNGYDVTIDPEEDEQGATAEAERFVAGLSEGQVRKVYNHYIEPWTVLEDLMQMSEKERITIVAEIMGWRADDIKRLNDINLN